MRCCLVSLSYELLLCELLFCELWFCELLSCEHLLSSRFTPSLPSISEGGYMHATTHSRTVAMLAPRGGGGGGGGCRNYSQQSHIPSTELCELVTGVHTSSIFPGRQRILIMEAADSDIKKTLSAIDYTVFTFVLVISATIGIYYGCTGGKQKTTGRLLNKPM